MPNPYFAFKQFTVFHDRSTMKVGTDGVLLGAWAPLTGNEKQILDIGTGCGLIALMLAQRACRANITAIDIDPASVEQAAENFAASPWPERLQAANMAAQALADSCDKRFDLVASNPPFFTSSLLCPRRERTQARHTCTLTHQELLEAGAKLLAPEGRFALILPVNEGRQFVETAREAGLHLTHQTTVFPTPASDAKRLLLCFSKMPDECAETQLVIESNGRHAYSDAYKQLTQDFYL